MQPWYAEWSNLSAEVAAAGGAGLAGDLFPEDDPALGQVIRGHFDLHGIADDRPDAKASHPASGIGDDAMTIFKHDAETGVGQDFVDHTIEGDDFFFGQNQAD